MNAMTKRVLLIAGLAAFAIVPIFFKSYGVYLCTLFCVTLMATYGLNLTVGYAGQMSLAQAAFYGIGAYTAANLALKWGVSFWWCLPAAALAAMLMAAILSLVVTRMEGIVFALGVVVVNLCNGQCLLGVAGLPVDCS